MARSSRFAVDLGLLTLLVVATAAALLVPGTPEPVEWVLGVPFLLLYPGYAVVAALFPRSPDLAGGPSANPGGGPGWVARLALALGASGVVVASIGVVLGWTVGFELPYVLGAVGAVTLASVVVASLRRRHYPAERRADPLAGWTALLRPAGTRLQTFAMALAVVALVASVAYAGATAPPREGFTEFSVLHEGEEGELVATDYPESFVAGEGHPLFFVVENHEGQPMDYDVVVLAETAGGDGVVTDEEQLDRFSVEAAADERAVVERQVAPTDVGEGVRLRFLLYKDGAPDDPSVDDADLSLQLWVDVVEG